MAINGDALLQAARGTVFTAPAKTSIPTAGVKQFLLNSGSVKVGTADTPVWDNSRPHVQFQQDQLQQGRRRHHHHRHVADAAARTSTEAPTITVSGASVQGDKATLKKVTGGWDGDHGGVIVPIKPIVQKLALFVLAYDDGDKLSFGLYLPETDFTFDTIDLTGDEFAEFSFNAVVKSTDALKKGPNGETGGYALFSPEDFK